MKVFRAACSLCLGLLTMLGAAHAQTLQRVDVGGGKLSPPVAQGDYLYVGTGATVSVWNMADPTEPVFAGRTSATPTSGPISALAIVGGYLYAGWSAPDGTGGITLYSLADPAHPVGAGEFDDWVVADYKGPIGLAVSGNYLYIGDSQNGVFAVDASDPLVPVVVGTVGDVYEFDAMAAFGNQLLTTGNSLIGGRVVNVLDISAPAMPLVAGQAVLDGGSVLRAALTDGYAIGVGNDLLVYDVHDPANIAQVFSAPIDQATGAIRIGNTLYLVGDSGIQVWDFTTPASTTLLRTVAMPTFAPDQTAATPFGPIVLTHTDRAVLLDIADPHQPTLAAQFTLPIGVSAHAGAIGADYAVIAEEGYGLAVADATTLAPVGRYDADLPADLAARDVEDISVDAGRAYLATWGYGVLIADLTDPLHPVELGRFEFPFASAIEAHGNRVYVASTTNGGIFEVLDVSNPASPQLLGSLTTSKTYDLTVRGNYAYLVDGADFADGGLRVVDVSNPAAPVVAGQEGSCPYANGIDVSADGNTAYIACASDAEFANALQIVDTTDKAHPVLLGSVALPGTEGLPDYNNPHSVVVVGNIAYVGNEYGLDEVDVSNRAAPVQTFRHPTGYFVSKVERAADGRIFAFAQAAGVFVFAPLASDSIFANGFE
ncbi:MAG: hypothetical protein ABIR62_17185 [Dokdonella sp.]|uniref:LVIVD repeat-containing protein n=1 Tax=Dokdonella sp. TaxID=2291710 RepID=UPI0032674B38